MISSGGFFRGKRKTNWPFSQRAAEAICREIARGGRLTKLAPHFPSYNVLCRWRRENPDFNQMVLTAYEDRQEFLSIEMPFLKSIGSDTSSLRREAARQVGVRYPKDLKKKIDKRRESYVIDTGISSLEICGGRLKS